MNSLIMILLALVIATTPVSSLKCWLCKASNEGPKSFAECDADKTEEKCGTKKGRVPACGMFIYKSKTGVLIHAKSCVYQHYCGANGTFCQNIALAGSDCRLECCDPELCNYKEFKSTTPGPTILNKTTPEMTTEGKTTTEIETTTEGSDAGSSHLCSGVLLVACATGAMLYHSA